MKKFWMAALLVIAPLTATANPSPAKEKITVSELDEAIPPPVKALGTPAMRSFPNGIRMAVSASTAEAQEHVNQGLNHLHGGWEFEASRHFAAAMRIDPDCLIAHWGMIMTLLNPSPETGPARNAATDRMLALIEAGHGTELERGYAYALVKYIEEGPEGAATAFRKVAAKFPNDMQSAIFAALFSRGGFDAAGDATPSQETAERSLLELVEKFPQSPVPLNALLFIRAEGPNPGASLEMARRLSRMTPDYPPAFHLLGHYEWRCGNHREAASAFGRASSFFHRWMKENNATLADCPDWIKAECYRIVSLVSKGDFDTAYAAACRVAATPLPVDRPSSAGARFLLWEAKTLPARILIHQGISGNANQAAQSLPTPVEVTEFRKHTLAYWWIDGLRFALEAQRLLDAGKIDDARNVLEALTNHGEAMARTQSAAIDSGERSQWLRAFRALEVLAGDMRGRVALAGPKATRGTAYNWFSAAADRQRVEPILHPPLILTPMASRIGNFYLKSKQPAEAVEAFQRALTTFPNDMNSLRGLREAHAALGHQDETKALERQIEALKAE